MLIMLALLTPSGRAAMTVDFRVSASSGNAGPLTLDFTGDGSGNAALDATASESDAQALVNELDGTVGTSADPGVYNSSFSLVITADGPGDALFLSANGLGIGGGATYRIDDPPNETLTATADLADGKRVTVWAGHRPMLAETIPGPVRYAEPAGEYAEWRPAGIVAVQERTVTLFLGSVVGEQSHEPRVACFGSLSEALVELLVAKERTEKRAAGSQ